MYGLVIEGIEFFIEQQYGNTVLQKALKQAKLDTVTFSTHERYSERVVPNILSAVVNLTGESVEMVGILAGRYFVQFMILNGYGPLLRVMGRKFSDFVKGMDNLHEYFRFRLNFCNSSYAILKKEEKGSFQFVTMGIRFDNSVLADDKKIRDKSSSLMDYMPVDSAEFLKMFPFFLAFDKNLSVHLAGPKLLRIMPELIGATMTDQFDLTRPAVKFSISGIMAHLNNQFQMESLFPIQKQIRQKAISFAVNDVMEDAVNVPKEAEAPAEEHHEDEMDNLPYLILNGPMLYLKRDDLLLYLPTVTATNLDEIFQVGLYLQDYGHADCYKEILMATVQKSDDLKDMLKAGTIKEKERSVELAHMMKEIEVTRKTARDLLTSMLPRSVANELLATGQASTVCETFESVTLAFVKVCDFLKLTIKLEAVQIVGLLNTVYSAFDEIITRHGVYKVETVGESYLISSGVPIRNDYHAEYVADAALDFINDIKLVDFAPLGGRGKINVKIGINSGPIVGAVVGKRSPRYCLFGDTVNTASRMESHNKMAMTIQCGQASKDAMEACAPGKFKFKHRGVVNLKGKGETKTYTLVSKAGRPRYMTNPLIEFAADETGNMDAVQEEEDMAYTAMDDDGDRSANASRMSLSAMSNEHSSATNHSRNASRISNSGFDDEDFGVKGVVLENIGPAIKAADFPDIGLGSNLEQLIEDTDLRDKKKRELKEANEREEKKKKKRSNSSSRSETNGDATAEEKSKSGSRPSSGRKSASGRRSAASKNAPLDQIPESPKADEVVENGDDAGKRGTKQVTEADQEDDQPLDELARLVEPPFDDPDAQPQKEIEDLLPLPSNRELERRISVELRSPSPSINIVNAPSPPKASLDKLSSQNSDDRLRTPTPALEPKSHNPNSPNHNVEDVVERPHSPSPTPSGTPIDTPTESRAEGSLLALKSRPSSKTRTRSRSGRRDSARSIAAGKGTPAPDS